jgi:protein SCO1/2
MRRINSAKAGLVLMAVLFVLLGIISGKHLLAALSAKPIELTAIELLPEPKPLPEIMLRNANGEAFPREKFLGIWNLVVFGFTSCPDFCPMELQKLASLIKLARQHQSDVQVIFVSVDPERDSAEKLAQHAAFFHPDIIGLRGDNPAIASFARFFGAAYDRSAVVDSKVLMIPAGAPMPATVGEQYLVNHSTRIFVVDPQGQYIGSLRNAESPEVVWSDLVKLF